MSARRFRATVAVAGVGLALTLAGCGQGSGGSASGNSSSSGGGSDTPTVAFVPKLQGIPYFEAMNAGGKAACEELGCN
jgi:rhamnose transport system substrate-binding protein